MKTILAALLALALPVSASALFCSNDVSLVLVEKVGSKVELSVRGFKGIFLTGKSVHVYMEKLDPNDLTQTRALRAGSAVDSKLVPADNKTIYKFIFDAKNCKGNPTDSNVISCLSEKSQALGVNGFTVHRIVRTTEIEGLEKIMSYEVKINLRLSDKLGGTVTGELGSELCD